MNIKKKEHLKNYHIKLNYHLKLMSKCLTEKIINYNYILL